MVECARSIQIPSTEDLIFFAEPGMAPTALSAQTGLISTHSVSVWLCLTNAPLLILLVVLALAATLDILSLLVLVLNPQLRLPPILAAKPGTQLRKSVLNAHSDTTSMEISVSLSMINAIPGIYLENALSAMLDTTSSWVCVKKPQIKSLLI